MTIRSLLRNRSASIGRSSRSDGDPTPQTNLGSTSRNSQIQQHHTDERLRMAGPNGYPNGSNGNSSLELDQKALSSIERRATRAPANSNTKRILSESLNLLRNTRGPVSIDDVRRLMSDCRNYIETYRESSGKRKNVKQMQKCEVELVKLETRLVASSIHPPGSSGAGPSIESTSPRISVDSRMPPASSSGVASSIESTSPRISVDTSRASGSADQSDTIPVSDELDVVIPAAEDIRPEPSSDLGAGVEQAGPETVEQTGLTKFRRSCDEIKTMMTGLRNSADRISNPAETVSSKVSETLGAIYKLLDTMKLSEDVKVAQLRDDLLGYEREIHDILKPREKSIGDLISRAFPIDKDELDQLIQASISLQDPERNTPYQKILRGINKLSNARYFHSITSANAKIAKIQKRCSDYLKSQGSKTEKQYRVALVRALQDGQTITPSIINPLLQGESASTSHAHPGILADQPVSKEEFLRLVKETPKTEREVALLAAQNARPSQPGSNPFDEEVNPELPNMPSSQNARPSQPGSNPFDEEGGALLAAQNARPSQSGLNPFDEEMNPELPNMPSSQADSVNQQKTSRSARIRTGISEMRAGFKQIGDELKAINVREGFEQIGDELKAINPFKSTSRERGEVNLSPHLGPVSEYRSDRSEAAHETEDAISSQVEQTEQTEQTQIPETSRPTHQAPKSEHWWTRVANRFRSSAPVRKVEKVISGDGFDLFPDVNYPATDFADLKTWQETCSAKLQSQNVRKSEGEEKSDYSEILRDIGAVTGTGLAIPTDKMTDFVKRSMKYADSHVGDVSPKKQERVRSLQEAVLMVRNKLLTKATAQMQGRQYNMPGLFDLQLSDCSTESKISLDELRASLATFDKLPEGKSSHAANLKKFLELKAGGVVTPNNEYKTAAGAKKAHEELHKLWTDTLVTLNKHSSSKGTDVAQKLKLEREVARALFGTMRQPQNVFQRFLERLRSRMVKVAVISAVTTALVGAGAVLGRVVRLPFSFLNRRD